MDLPSYCDAVMLNDMGIVVEYLPLETITGRG